MENLNSKFWWKILNALKNDFEQNWPVFNFLLIKNSFKNFTQTRQVHEILFISEPIQFKTHFQCAKNQLKDKLAAKGQ